MTRSLRLSAAAALLVGSVWTVPAPADPGEIAKVGAIVARSKSTRETYAAYYWNRMEHPGQPTVEEWSAEFNAGGLHRVETPRDRVIADCAARTGTYLSLPTGNVVTGSQVAGVACGISTNRQFLTMESLGRIKTRFGDADRVRVADAELVRTYDISDDGIILRTIFETNDNRHLTVLDVETVAISRTLPRSDIFNEASLKNSVVPDYYKVAPKSPI